MVEIWKDVPGYEGLYQVSNMGRVRSFLIGGRKKKNSIEIDKISSTPKILRVNTKDRNKYPKVQLTRFGVHRYFKVHRLVAKTFIPNPNCYPEVNHIDGDKCNNKVENLEWCSSSYNVRHSIKMHPNQLDGMIMYNRYVKTEPILQISKNGEVLRLFSSCAEAARETGVCSRNILQVANHTPFNAKGQTRKTAGGYVWRYESEVIDNDC